jgi:hypothetical protein
VKTIGARADRRILQGVRRAGPRLVEEHAALSPRTHRRGGWRQGLARCIGGGANFDALTKSEGWARSSLDVVTMRQHDDIRVHFEVVFSRYQADGIRYPTYQSLWIVTRKDGAWGVQARSSFAP